MNICSSATTAATARTLIELQRSSRGRYPISGVYCFCVRQVEYDGVLVQTSADLYFTVGYEMWLMKRAFHIQGNRFVLSLVRRILAACGLIYS